MNEAEIIKAQNELILAQQNLISMMRLSGGVNVTDQYGILPKKREITLSEYARAFLKSRENTAKKTTYNNYVWCLKQHILPELGDTKLYMIDNSCLQGFADKKAKTLSTKSVRDLVGLVKNIMNDACINEITEPKKFMIKFQESEKPDKAILAEDEFKELEDDLFKQNKPHAIGELIMLETGMRIGEICGLKWGDINTTDRTIRICRTVYRIYDPESRKTEINIGKPKTRRSERIVPINKRLNDYLRRHRQDVNIFVASGRENPTEPRLQRANHARLLKKNGITYIPPHGLRHTFATRAIRCGVDPKTVAAMLGHTNSKITLDIYTSVTEEMLRSGIDKMSRERSD